MCLTCFFFIFFVIIFHSLANVHRSMQNIPFSGLFFLFIFPFIHCVFLRMNFCCLLLFIHAKLINVKFIVKSEIKCSRKKKTNKLVWDNFFVILSREMRPRAKLAFCVWLQSFCSALSTKLLNHVILILLWATKNIFIAFFASLAIFAACLLFFVSTFCIIIFWTVSMFTHLISFDEKQKKKWCE